ncbi:Cys-tRNA(Pro)/Cys-tRNA(Cys) deacylase YbaK [Desulfosarcina cetonica]|uniref:Cys-tRNA(Pro) deacylase n=1 Tax=Desulfosarcina cetonica TaxID=90730 RepID=UPI0006D0053A|nr:Cys-tRNA(Pro) deacylase [Desulfosarcina cetonica]VTR63849.1 Cys-tRNA(Pro)/Cys-tRNA(Cys) deacylase YbaK [Desulfosarcina cetonica]
MTPAIDFAKRHGIVFQIHKYKHDKDNRHYGAEAAEKLKVSPERLCKTLVIAMDDRDLAVAVLPVARQLDLKRAGQALGCKRAQMADKRSVEKTTGYILGGVSPLGQKRRLNTVIDASVEAFETILVSAGRRGLDIELTPGDLCAMTHGFFAEISK